MSARRLLLNIHLVVGLKAAAFLLILGLTGGVIAFEYDYDRWLHPSLWYVTPQAARLSEQALIDKVQQRFAPARVEEIRFSGDGLAQSFSLTNHVLVFVNPYDGNVLGARDYGTAVAEVVSFLQRLHVSLAAGYYGRWLVDIATIEMLLLIPTGVCLWWKKKRLTVSRKSPWRRINCDLHNAAGAYAGVFILLASVTGVFIAFEPLIYLVTRSTGQRVAPVPHSVGPATQTAKSDEAAAKLTRTDLQQSSTAVVSVDQILQTANTALPELETVGIVLPLKAKNSYAVMKSVPEWQAGSAKCIVYVDQFSGQVLRIDDVRQFTRGFRGYHINQSLHTGQILGLPGKIIMSLSSMLMAVLAVTGVMLGWKKLPIGAVLRLLRFSPRQRKSSPLQTNAITSVRISKCASSRMGEG